MQSLGPGGSGTYPSHRAGFPWSHPRAQLCLRGAFAGTSTQRGHNGPHSPWKEGQCEGIWWSKAICGCASRPVGPGGRCEDRLAPPIHQGLHNTRLSPPASLPDTLGTQLVATRLPFPPALQRWGAACLQLLADARVNVAGSVPSTPGLGQRSVRSSPLILATELIRVIGTQPLLSGSWAS